MDGNDLPPRYRVLGRKGEREGLNILYKIAGVIWVLLGSSSPSLNIKDSFRLIRKGLHLYEEQLKINLAAPACLPYSALIDEGYLKKKHWVYACYMATLSSLPLLYKLQAKNVLLEAILGKTSIGTSTKLLDNLNDSIQTIEEALASLHEYRKALTDPQYEIPRFFACSSKVSLAENSSYVIGNWVSKLLVRCNAPHMYKEYIDDVNKLIEGQIDSLTHRSQGRTARTIEEYLISISEKSIGNVWLDVDLCFLEDGLGSLDSEALRALNTLREGYELIFKASLIYDDAQDMSTDIREGAINSSLLLGLEEGVIRPDNIDRSDPQSTIERLDKSGVTSDTIYLADMLLIKGIRRIEDVTAPFTDIVDWRALTLSFRLLRLFNLRKILVRKRNREILRLFISSLRDFSRIEAEIPDHILKLARCI